MVSLFCRVCSPAAGRRWNPLAMMILVALGSSAGGNFCADAATPPAADAAQRIIGYAMGPSPLAVDLRALTDGIGGRVTGTPAMERAVAWGVAAFRAAGVDVHTESWELPVTWAEGASTLELTGSAAFPVSIVSVAWAPATPAGGIDAPIVDVGEGGESDYARAGGAVRGAMVLVHTDVIHTWADLTDEYDRAPPIIRRAVEGGARAILWIGARDHRVLYRHTDAVAAEIAALPMAILAREDGLRLARATGSDPGKVRGRLSLPNRIGGPVRQENVVGEIRGRELPDEIVVLGAHLDSWELGTGALDDGCNAAMVIAAARAIRESGARPRRTLRFILFSGEEQGLMGSRAYVAQHRAELDRTRAMITFDSGNGRVTGYSLGGRDDIRPGVEAALAPLADWDVGHHTADASTGTDNLDFLLAGVPTLVANQDPEDYMVNYHASTDTLDKVDIRALALHAAIAAVTAYQVADLPTPLGPRQTRAEIEALMQRTGLDRELKVQGMWPEWASGARGRYP